MNEGLICGTIKYRMRELVKWNDQKPDYLPVTEDELRDIDKHWIGITRAKAADPSMDTYNLWNVPLIIVPEKVIDNLFGDLHQQITDMKKDYG